MPETDAIPVAEPPPLADYAGARSGFRWRTVAADLGADLTGLNLGGLATERQVAAGRGSEHALVWYPAQGAPERLTYTELAEASARVANMLAANGVQRGDRVLFLLPIIPELYTGLLGALRAGTVVSVLAPGRNVDYLRNILQRTRPTAMVTVVSFRNTIASLRRETPSLKNVFLINRSKLATPPLSGGESRWADAFELAPAEFETVRTSLRDRALIHYTELGMSGNVLAHGLALPLFHTARSVLEMRAGEATLSVGMPGDHYFATYGILAPMLAGATHVIFEDPAHFARWADVDAEIQPRSWFSSFKAIDVILRTDPNLGTLLSHCRNIACTWPYDRGFVSMTALSYRSPLHAVWTDREFGAIQCAELRGSEIRPGSIGRPLPGVEARVVDEAGTPVGPDAPGRLAVKIGLGAPSLGYWDDKELTNSNVRDGWFVTSHAAKMDADGYVWLES